MTSDFKIGRTVICTELIWSIIIIKKWSRTLSTKVQLSSIPFVILSTCALSDLFLYDCINEEDGFVENVKSLIIFDKPF